MTHYDSRIKMYYFDTSTFTAKGVPFKIVDTTTKEGQTIDTVKNMNSGKLAEFERSELAKLILNR